MDLPQFEQSSKVSEEKRAQRAIQRMSDGYYHLHPEEMAKDIYDVELQEWQKRAIRKLLLGEKNRLSIRAGHSCGKSFLDALIAHIFMLLFIPSYVLATGPTGKQTKHQFWSYIKFFHDRNIFQNMFDWQKTKMFVKGSEEQWKLVWMTSKDPKTIEGFHGPDEGKNLLWIIEEAKGVESGVFESIMGALSSDDNFFLISSTCGPPRGYFFDTHTRLRNLWDTEHVPSTESPYVNQEQIDRWREEWGEDSAIFRARVLAEFPADSEDQIASLGMLMRALEENEHIS